MLEIPWDYQKNASKWLMFSIACYKSICKSICHLLCGYRKKNFASYCNYTVWNNSTFTISCTRNKPFGCKVLNFLLANSKRNFTITWWNKYHWYLHHVITVSYLQIPQRLTISRREARCKITTEERAPVFVPELIVMVWCTFILKPLA